MKINKIFMHFFNCSKYLFYRVFPYLFIVFHLKDYLPIFLKSNLFRTKNLRMIDYIFIIFLYLL